MAQDEKNYKISENKWLFSSIEYDIQISCIGHDGFYGSTEKQDKARNIIQNIIKDHSLETLQGGLCYRLVLHLDKTIKGTGNAGERTNIVKEPSSFTSKLIHIRSNGVPCYVSESEGKALAEADKELILSQTKIKDLKYWKDFYFSVSGGFAGLFIAAVIIIFCIKPAKPAPKAPEPIKTETSNNEFNQEAFDKIKAEEFKKEWNKDRGAK